MDVPRLIRPADAMAALGGAIAPRLRAGDAVLLWGPLGAGKSTLARGLLRALIGPEAEAPSPTFTLVQYYESPSLRLAHLDLYRLGAPEEVFELGLEEAMAEGAVVIEWPERLGGALPPDRLDIVIAFDAEDDEARRVVVSPKGAMRERFSGERG
jgi:tRNA threonylcarbamoyladenosine biosynthesis protein TsaE